MSESDEVPPLHSVALMVVITIALSAVVGAFVLELGGQGVTQPPSVNAVTNGTNAAVTVTDGSTSELRVVDDNGTVYARFANVSTGDTRIISDLPPNTTLRVVSVSNESSRVVEVIKTTK